MRKRLAVLFALAMTLALVTSASASHILWFQGFEQDADGWDDAGGVYGSIERVSSGTNGVNSADGSFHAIVNGTDSTYPTGPYSFFDGPRSEWPGTWAAEIDVYLDPAWSEGTGFDYSVASYGSDGDHLRDFIVHIGVVDVDSEEMLLANASNNSDWQFNGSKLITNNDGNYGVIDAAGWYTLQHVFRDDNGALAVDINVLDESGNTVFTATRSNAADTIADVVGGNGYSWFVYSSADDLAIDNHELYLPTSDPLVKNDCKNGGYADFGFSNQGQCIKFVNTGEDSR